MTAPGRAPEIAGAPDEHAPPTGGWLSAALAMHAVQRRPDTMTLRLDVAGHGPLTLDYRHHAYDWATPLDAFPAEPESVRIETQAITPDAPPPFELPGRDLDALLWHVARAAFGDALAPWLDPARHYRIARRPSLAEAGIGLDHVRMISMLGNGYASPAVLAAAAQAEPTEANRVINAFALIGILRVAPLGPPA